MLLRRARQGDERAFVQLIRRYRQMLVGYIRSRIGHSDDAEDVLQETLVAAWTSLHQLRDPGSVRAWLLQVAHNRCRDYFRASQRRDVPTQDRDLEERANRFGMRQYPHLRAVTEAVEALECVPMTERETAKRFYLDGLSIAEIAAETQSSPGTVKRRLYQARKALRLALGVPLQERSLEMAKQTQTISLPAFPMQRPKIVITPSDEPPFVVDCPELRWWSIIPRIGEQAAWADYSPPDWKLAEATEIRVVQPAKVHDLEGVEIAIRPWKAAVGWQTPWTMYGRLTDEKAQYLAVAQPYEGAIHLETFHDALFQWNWGEMERRLEDRGRFVQAADGTLRRALEGEDTARNGAGVFRVEIGGKAFTCLRVFDLEGTLDDIRAPVNEGYLTREGRTVLKRNFCHPEAARDAQFQGAVDETEWLMIDGVRFVHWYDTLTSLAL
jgi:RNA polymerase sigma-70 factor (ECF subfamily)